MKCKFMVRFPNTFHSFELYGKDGDYVYNLEAAIEAADEFHPGWSEVYNGHEGATNPKEVPNG